MSRDRVKVEGGFSWGGLWLIGFMFTMGYANPSIDGLWEFLMYLIVWPLHLGEALRIAEYLK